MDNDNVLRETIVFRNHIIRNTWDLDNPMEFLSKVPIVKQNVTPLHLVRYGYGEDRPYIISFRGLDILFSDKPDPRLEYWNIYKINRNIFSQFNIDINADVLYNLQDFFENGLKIQIYTENNRIIPLWHVYAQSCNSTTDSVSGDVYILISKYTLDKIGATGNNLTCTIYGDKRSFNYTNVEHDGLFENEYPTDIILVNGHYVELNNSSILAEQEDLIQIYETGVTSGTNKVEYNLLDIPSIDIPIGIENIEHRVIHIPKNMNASNKILHCTSFDVFLVRNITDTESLYNRKGICLNNLIYDTAVQITHNDFLLKYSDILSVAEGLLLQSENVSDIINKLKIIIYPYANCAYGNLLDTKNKIVELYEDTDENILNYLSSDVHLNPKYYWSSVGLFNNIYFNLLKWPDHKYPNVLKDVTLSQYVNSFGFVVSMELLSKRIFIINNITNEPITGYDIGITLPPYYMNKRLDVVVQVMESHLFVGVLDTHISNQKLYINIDGFDDDVEYQVEIFEALPSYTTLVCPGENRIIKRKHKDYCVFELKKIKNRDVYRWYNSDRYDPNKETQEEDPTTAEQDVFINWNDDEGPGFLSDLDSVWNDYEVVPITSYGINRYIEHIEINDVAYISFKPEFNDRIFAVSFGGGYIRKSTSLGALKEELFLEEIVDDYFEDGYHIREINREKQYDSMLGTVAICAINNAPDWRNKLVPVFWDNDKIWAESALDRFYFTKLEKATMYNAVVPNYITGITLDSESSFVSDYILDSNNNNVWVNDNRVVAISKDKLKIGIIDILKESVVAEYEFDSFDPTTEITDVVFRQLDNVIFCTEKRPVIHAFNFENNTITPLDTYVIANDISGYDRDINIVAETDTIIVKNIDTSGNISGTVFEYKYKVDQNNSNIFVYKKDIPRLENIDEYSLKEDFITDPLTGEMVVYTTSGISSTKTIIAHINKYTHEIEHEKVFDISLSNLRIFNSVIVCTSTDGYIYRILWYRYNGFTLQSSFTSSDVVKYFSNIETLNKDSILLYTTKTISNPFKCAIFTWNLDEKEWVKLDIVLGLGSKNIHGIRFLHNKDNKVVVLYSVEDPVSTWNIIRKEYVYEIPDSINNISYAYQLLEKNVPFPKFFHFNGVNITDTEVLTIRLNDKILKSPNGDVFEFCGIKFSYPYTQNFTYTDKSVFTLSHRGQEYSIAESRKDSQKEDRQANKEYYPEEYELLEEGYNRYRIDAIKIGDVQTIIDWDISYDNSVYIPLATMDKLLNI